MIIKTMRNFLLILTLFAALAIPSAATAQTTLKADTVSISCSSSDTFLIPIRVLNFTDIGSFQFSLMWDTAKLDYAYTTDLNPLFLGPDVDFDFNTTQINAGKIAFLWTKTNGLTVGDSTIVFELAFRRSGGSFAPLMFVDSPVPIEIASTMGDILNFAIMNGGVMPIDDKAPEVFCPADVTTQDNGATPVFGIAPDSITDNCAPVANVGWASTGATTASQPNDPDASGALFNIGLSTVTYTATDVGGNTATCSFSVTVEFVNTSDTLTIVAQNNSASCGQSVSIDITALNFDSIGSLQFSLGWDLGILQFDSVNNFNPDLQLNQGTDFNLTQTANGLLAFLWTADAAEGVTLPTGAVLFTINFTVVGGGGTNSTLVFGDVPVPREAISNATGTPEEVPALWINGSVNVTDNVPPALDCPDNVTVDLPPGSTTAQLSGLEPTTLQDNCGGTPSLSYVRSGATTGSGSGNANGTYNPGVTTVTYTATDQSGNTSTCTFTVTVNVDGALVLLIDSVEVDCQASGGQIAVNLTVEDWNNIIGLQFGVTWDPAVLSLDTVNNDFPGLNLSGSDFNFATAPTGSFLFFGGGLNSNWPQLPDGSVFFTMVFDVLDPAASSAISFSGTIEAVNSSVMTVPVLTVNGGYFSGGADISPPSVTCPDSIFAVTLDGCLADVDVPLPQASDDCSGVDSIFRNPDGNIFPVGSTTVIYTVTDSVGNSATCSLTVTVDDGVPPVVVCPNDTTETAIDGCVAFVDLPLAQASDACSGIDTVFRVPDGNSFVTGTTIVTYTAVDSSGNSATCSFSVMVFESTVPFFTDCPAGPITGVASSNSCFGQVNWQPPTAMDPCGPDGLTVSSNYTPDSLFSVGETMVTYVVTDFSGNSNSCNFLVQIFETVDPILVCPDSFSVAPDGSPDCGAVVTFDPPQGFDNCDPDVQIIAAPGNLMSGDTFPSGSTTLAFSAIDDSGNEATCAFTVTVLDDALPVLTCPNDSIWPAAQDTCGAFPTWGDVTAIDFCDGALIPTSIFTPGQFFPVGPTVVTYVAFDQAGNSGFCEFTIIVTEDIPPIIIGCPGPVGISLPVGVCQSPASWTPPTAADNCTMDPVLTSTHAPGDTFQAGTTVVTYTATDLVGNETTCTFNVVVDDDIAPQFSNCPPNTLPLSAPPCGIPVFWDPPTATDNCTPESELVIFSSHAPGDTFYNGMVNVVYLVKDANENYDTCAFTVTVMATPAPGFTGVPMLDTIFGCSQPVSWNPPMPIGFCVLADTFSTHQPGDTFPVGTTQVTYTWVEGATNNQTSVTFNVVIVDNEVPAIACPSGPVVVNAGGSVISDLDTFLVNIIATANCDGVELDFDLPLASDNCGIDTLFESDGLPPGAIFPVGTETLVFLARDVSGNTSLCEVAIEVQGLPALNPVAFPQLGCLNDTVTVTATAIAGAVYTWNFTPSNPPGPQVTLPSTTNTYFIGSFASANEGTYTVSAIVNGCPVPPGSVNLVMTQSPVANEDIWVIAPGSTGIFNVLQNDTLVPPSDFEIVSHGDLNGLIKVDSLGEGFFAYQGEPGQFTFLYRVCSKSCPDDEDLCDDALVTITVRDTATVCKAFNVMTPDKDGINDYFVVDCLNFGLFPDNSLVVYNQWGDKVYETKGYNNMWDGTLDGEPGKDLPDGVYFYVFKPGPGEPTLKGFVEIFR